ATSYCARARLRAFALRRASLSAFGLRRARPCPYNPRTGKRVSAGWRFVMRKLAWLLLFAGVVGISLSLQAQQPAADLILFNGKIITVNDTFAIAQAVAVRGNRVVAVGSNADVNRLAGPNTQR